MPDANINPDFFWAIRIVFMPLSNERIMANTQNCEVLWGKIGKPLQ